MVCVGAFCHVVFKAAVVGAWTVIIASLLGYFVGLGFTLRL
jgi:hypothetical protein